VNQKCDTSTCDIAAHWGIREPKDCLSCDDNGDCGYKVNAVPQT